MELTHTFTVPVGIEEAWAHFNDIARVAECFPGAKVTSVEDDTFNGTVKVKLGPIALQYNGSGTFVEKDDAAHRFVVDAKGKDKRGNGTAGAKVVLAMTAAGDASTDVEVNTDLAITGKPAQFGRGVMQDVSDKLLGQFVKCLENRMSATEPEGSAGSAPSGEAANEAAGAMSADPSGGVSAAAPAGAPPPTPIRPTPPPTATPEQDDALNLGATVLPVLAKTYWKQALGVVVVLLVLRRLLRN